MIPDFDLKNKVIAISGGAQGLGLTQAEALVESGAIVHIFDRQPEPREDSRYARVAKRAQDEFATKITYHQIDVRADPDKLNSTCAAIADEHGRFDGLIAAAAIQQEVAALDYTPEAADRQLGVNITGVLMTANAVARQMLRLKQGGSLVLIASMSGTVANKGLLCTVYNASKAGVVQLARNLAAEWGQHGIRVNTISPGYIITEMTASLFEAFPERKEEWPKQNMLGRLSKPEDYRGAAVFLLSDASKFMTGKPSFLNPRSILAVFDY